MERYLPRLRMPMTRLWTTLLFVMLSLATFAQRPFITTWQTTAASETVTIPINPDVNGYNYTVDWGDGTAATNHTKEDAIHTYATPGTHTVEITGNFPAIRLGSYGIEVTDKLLSVDQWGDIAWTSMDRAFSGARYMVLNATDAPNLSGVSSLARMFSGAELVNGDLGGWDVSGITTMEVMFNGVSAFNGDISGWKTFNVTNMSDMFQSAESFNRDLTNWDVSAVQNMQGMFFMASSFNGDLSDWAPSNVTNMIAMFESATSFDQHLGDWDITNVESMDGMLKSSGLSTANYDATLIGWAAQGNIPHGILLGAQELTYCTGTDARKSLIDEHGWEINDAGEAADCTSGGGDVTPGDPANFVTTWKTDNSGPSEDNQIIVPATGDFNYIWENEANSAETGGGSGSGPTIITFPQAGTYKLSIQPTGSTPFDKIAFFEFSNDDKSKIITVNNWGAISWSGFQFNGCSNLKVTATDIPDLSGVTDLSWGFSKSGIDEIPNINGWDMSNVTNLGSFLQHVAGFNQSLSDWDVSKVTNMAFMFDGATSFNQPLDSWDVSSLEQFDYMFRNASGFNQSLGAWNLASLVGGVGVFSNSGLSCENYSYTLYGWATNPNTNADVLFHPWAPMEYSPDVVPYRDFLINDLGWEDFYGDVPGTCSITLPGTLTPSPEGILYVDINVNTSASGYTGAGDSWENAIPELADVLKWARMQHDDGSPDWTEAEPLRVFVAIGTYLPLYSVVDGEYTTDGGRDNSFVLVPDVQLYGGFDPAAGIETLADERILPDNSSPAGPTVLTGDLNGNDGADFANNAENAYHVVVAVGEMGSARLDGFTVIGGNADRTTSTDIAVFGYLAAQDRGGGMYFHQSSPVIVHCDFIRNSANSYGGGVHAETGSSPVLNRVVISGNSTPSWGGGMFNADSSPVLTNVVISGNSAVSGGGMYNFDSSPRANQRSDQREQGG